LSDISNDEARFFPPKIARVTNLDTLNFTTKNTDDDSKREKCNPSQTGQSARAFGQFRPV
jgi:hypothetical protein